MTEDGGSGAAAATDGPGATPDAASAPVDVAKLTAEAANKSGLLWVRVPGGDAFPVWHAWHDPGERGGAASALVVSGPGEQYLPWLPDESSSSCAARTPGAAC